jgi:hypothetical protein
MSQVDGLTWYKGRPCDSGACVEVAMTGNEVLVRSSVIPASRIILTCEEWREFLAGAKDGLFDHL